MKKLLFILSILPLALIAQNNVGIGTNSPNASALLDIESANKGLLIPRVSLNTLTDGVAPINAPEKGLMIWNTNASVVGGNEGFYFWSGSAWQPLGQDIEVDPKIATTTTKIVPFWNGSQLVNGSIYDHGSAGVTIGTSLSPNVKLEVAQSSSTKNAAIKGTGVFGPTNGYLGVQGKNSFDGVNGSDLDGNEIGVLGISTGGSVADNYGVFGFSNNWGGYFSNSQIDGSVRAGGSNNNLEVWSRPPNAASALHIQQSNTVGYSTNVSPHWQSFKPAKTGIINKIEVYINNPNFNAATNVTLELRSGIGNGGTVLESKTITLSATSSTTSFYYVFFLSTNVTAFNDYTYVLTAPSTNQAWVAYASSNVYSGGTSDVAGNDLAFKVYLEEILDVERALIVNQANVGVGKSSPTERLDVNGNIRFNGALMPDALSGSSGQLLQSNGAGTSPSWATLSSIYTDRWNINGSNIYTALTGNVGIGTAVPGDKLVVVGGRVEFTATTEATPTTGTGVLEIANSLRIDGDEIITNIGTTLLLQNDNNEDLKVDNGTLFVDASTNTVGIGTVAPTNGKLHVNGSVSTTLQTYGWMATSGATFSTPGPIARNVSIYASSRVACGNIAVFSDQRIKNILGISNAKADLNTLMKIEVTDYTMIDVVENGNQAFKKVIAQQVAEVYPMAVKKDLTDVVPDIYKNAEIKKGWIVLETNLKAGERVKIVTDNGVDIYEVLEIKRNKFRVNLPAVAEQKVFVYGREVDDFHTVDYEAIAMLNVSATQAQQKLIEAQQKEIEELKSQNIALQSETAKISILEKEMEEIKAMLGLQANAK